MATELVAIDRLRVYARGPERTPLEEGGYRFRWISEGHLPPLAVAGPVEPHRSGVRWFASLAGGADADLFEFDTVLNRAPGGVPDFEALRAFLTLPADKRSLDRRPFGWRRVLQP